MRSDTPQFWFTSDLFSVDPAEDEETNPFCYGKQLATWVAERYHSLGYSPEDVIPEDWGWCVMLEREPFMLWVGCTNIRSDFYERISPEEKPSFVPDGSTMTWTCFVGTDVPIWTSFYWKRLIGKASTDSRVSQVANNLDALLRNEESIHMTEQS